MQHNTYKNTECAHPVHTCVLAHLPPGPTGIPPEVDNSPPEAGVLRTLIAQGAPKLRHSSLIAKCLCKELEVDDSPESLDALFLVHNKKMMIGGPQITLLASDHPK
eukprot:43425-Pelagomonas_calceolata.AAC.2